MSSIKLTAETLSRADDLPQRLGASMAAGRAGMLRGAHTAPELTYGRHAGPAPATARHAAVLLLLFQRKREWFVPLTARPAALSRHGGQVSLPGGTIDAGETSDGAAVRELREELGFSEPVHLLGPLADSYVYVSNYVVTPWLASIQHEPRWQPNSAEVEQVIEFPLSTLLTPYLIERMTVRRGPLVFHAPCFQAGGHCIWGATSVILSEFQKMLLQLIA